MGFAASGGNIIDDSIIASSGEKLKVDVIRIAEASQNMTIPWSKATIDKVVSITGAWEFNHSSIHRSYSLHNPVNTIYYDGSDIHISNFNIGEGDSYTLMIVYEV